MDNAVEKLKESVPQIVKDNKGALIGAIIGVFLTDNKKAQSAILGAVAGTLLDKKLEEKND